MIANQLRKCRQCPLLSLVLLPVTVTFGATLGGNPVVAQTPAAAQSNAPDFQSAEQTNQAIDKSVDQAIRFLKNRGQADSGAFSPETGVAVTSLCVRAILDHRPSELNSPAVKRAIQYILDRVQPDGGIYSPSLRFRNYETSVAISALVAANTDNQYESQLTRAEAFIKELQWDEGEGVESGDVAYGGAGYGSHSRPDLSNTTFMLDALKDLGRDANDEAVQKALKFISRTQNLAGHGNDTEHADKIGDGGFYYTPAAGGETKVTENEVNGGLRSYGSMTYAGLKSMIYAGLTQDDPRVRAALSFIQDNYTLKENPGVGMQGLYYYYHTFGKALDAADLTILTDGEGINHRWNRELAATLISAQQADGSWVNKDHERWMEGNRNLVTAYALMALKHCRE